MNRISSICLNTILLVCTYGLAVGQEYVKTNFDTNSGSDSESFMSFTFNGSWCWFSDPRAVYFEGKYKRTYAGWIDNYGNITIGSYDHDTHKIETHIIKENLEVDDHDNPALLFDGDGKLLVFYTRHGYGDTPNPKPLYFAKAKKPELFLNGR